MRLSKSFMLDSLCVTSTGIDNTPEDNEKQKLLFVACYLLQPIADRFGTIYVHSGYRSRAVNKAIGGSRLSQHMLGEAVDFSVPGIEIETVFKWCIKNLVYGQLILEIANGKEWIHISLPRIGGQNIQVLTFDGKAYYPYKEITIKV
jgi:hypothetical protein